MGITMQSINGDRGYHIPLTLCRSARKINARVCISKHPLSLPIPPSPLSLRGGGVNPALTTLRVGEQRGRGCNLPPFLHPKCTSVTSITGFIYQKDPGEDCSNQNSVLPEQNNSKKQLQKQQELRRQKNFSWHCHMKWHEIAAIINRNKHTCLLTVGGAELACRRRKLRFLNGCISANNEYFDNPFFLFYTAWTLFILKNVLDLS